MVSREPVATYFDTHQENIIWFWSVVAAGGIPAILSPLANDLGARAAQLENVIQLLERPIVITSMGLAPDLTGPDGLRVVTIESLRNAAQLNGKVDGTAKRHLASSEQATKRTKLLTPQKTPGRNDLAVLLFTSGSTGPAKAVEFSNSQLIASVRMKSALHGIDSNMNFMSWVGKCYTTENVWTRTKTKSQGLITLSVFARFI